MKGQGFLGSVRTLYCKENQSLHPNLVFPIIFLQERSMGQVYRGSEKLIGEALCPQSHVIQGFQIISSLICNEESRHCFEKISKNESFLALVNTIRTDFRPNMKGKHQFTIFSTAIAEEERPRAHCGKYCHWHWLSGRWCHHARERSRSWIDDSGNHLVGSRLWYASAVVNIC